MLYNDEELKLLVSAELDIIEFMDCIGMSFDELIEVVWDSISEEGKAELSEAVE